jgi:hypothetical protein
MKKIIYLAILLGATVAMAKEECNDTVETSEVKEQKEITTDVPKHLEGAVIIVRLKDGRETTVPAEKFKVVPRKQQYLVTKVQNDKVTMCRSTSKHRVSVLAGKGPRGGLNRSQSGTTVSVESQYGATGGLQYQYQTDVKVFGMPLSVGGQAQENGTGLGMIGVDF